MLRSIRENMAHRLVAGRALGFRSSWKACSRHKLFVVGRTHPPTTVHFPRSVPRTPALGTVGTPPPTVLRCSLPHSDPVIVSSKECSDGSILFAFGRPEEQVVENVMKGPVDTGLASSTTEDEEVEVGQDGSVTRECTTQIEEANKVSTEDTTVKGQSNYLVNQDVTHEETEEKIQKEDASQSKLTKSGNMQTKSRKSTMEKDDEILRLHSSGAMRPHPEKVMTGGEDAYVIEGTVWAGVADGVGGWALDGVDAGIYARELMAHCGALAKSQTGVPNPKAVIIQGVRKTKAVGSCTAVIAALYKQTLYVANIGDSGFIVVRDGKVLARSTPMQRGFNFPYQIGSEGDDPEMAETFEVPVASGDVLVLATDGVYDNLFEREIVDVVDAGSKNGVEPGKVALWLVKLAHDAGLNKEGRSPFSVAAQAAGYTYFGGKLDDATVVVSYIEKVVGTPDA